MSESTDDIEEVDGTFRPFGEGCTICFGTETSEDSPLLYCDYDNACAHVKCAFTTLEEIQGNGLWHCQAHRIPEVLTGTYGRDLECMLCPRSDIPAFMMPVEGHPGKFIHTAELCFLQNISSVSPFASVKISMENLHSQMLCCYCKRAGGAIVKCLHDTCKDVNASYFHVMCAIQSDAEIGMKEFNVNGTMQRHPWIFCEKHVEIQHVKQRTFKRITQKLLSQPVEPPLVSTPKLQLKRLPDVNMTAMNTNDPKNELEERIEQLRKESGALADMCKNQSTQIAQCMLRVRNLQDSKRRLEQELAQTKSKCDTLNTNMLAADVLLQERNQSIQELNATIARIQAERDAMQYQNVALQNANSQYLHIFHAYHAPYAYPVYALPPAPLSSQ
jgi:hypothetical protein